MYHESKAVRDLGGHAAQPPHLPHLKEREEKPTEKCSKGPKVKQIACGRARTCPGLHNVNASQIVHSSLPNAPQLLEERKGNPPGEAQRHQPLGDRRGRGDGQG